MESPHLKLPTILTSLGRNRPASAWEKRVSKTWRLDRSCHDSPNPYSGTLCPIWQGTWLTWLELRAPSQREFLLGNRSWPVMWGLGILTCYPWRHSQGCSLLRWVTQSSFPPSSHLYPPPSLPLPHPIDLLSHPTLGVRRTRGSSSKVRFARQGTEFSSGLRAFSARSRRQGKEDTWRATARMKMEALVRKKKKY